MTTAKTELEEAKLKYPLGSRVRFLGDLSHLPDEGIVIHHTGSGFVRVTWDSDEENLNFHYKDEYFQPIPLFVKTQDSQHRHKHADLIIAWANGAEIEYKQPESDVWYRVQQPYWTSDLEFRVKATKPADIVVEKFIEFAPSLDNAYNKPNVRYTFDGETKALKAVELLDNSTES